MRVGFECGPFDRQAQRREIIRGLLKHTPERLMTALELEDGAIPLCKPLAAFR